MPEMRVESARRENARMKGAERPNRSPRKPPTGEH